MQINYWLKHCGNLSETTYIQVVSVSWNCKNFRFHCKLSLRKPYGNVHSLTFCWKMGSFHAEIMQYTQVSILFQSCGVWIFPLEVVVHVSFFKYLMKPCKIKQSNSLSVTPVDIVLYNISIYAPSKNIVLHVCQPIDHMWIRSISWEPFWLYIDMSPKF